MDGMATLTMLTSSSVMNDATSAMASARPLIIVGGSAHRAADYAGKSTTTREASRGRSQPPTSRCASCDW
jgi:hypothetical protein